MKFPTLNIDQWILQTIAMILTCYLIPKLKITSIFGAFFMVIALAFINANVWDLALFMKVPDEPTNQMVVLFVTNGVLFWLLVKILPGIEMTGFTPALIAPIVFTVCGYIISALVKDVNWQEFFNWAVNFLGDLKDFVITHLPDSQDPAVSATPIKG